jgi:hypothetical protein
MRTRTIRTGLTGLALALVGTLTLFGPGAAIARTRTHKTVVVPILFLQGKNGFQLQILGARHRVTATVAKAVRLKPEAGASSGTLTNEYVTRGRATPTRVRASFGQIGRVDVRFKPSGKREAFRPNQKCHAEEIFLQPGHFTGSVSFTGEERYASFHARHFKGAVVEVIAGCSRPNMARAAKASQARARLTAETPSGGLGLEALGFGASKRPTFGAFEKRRLGNVSERRTAISEADENPGAFEFDEGLTTATLRPSSPFEGTATFERAADGTTTWSGDLRADFLGGPPVALTGPPIEADLIRPGRPASR